VVPIPDDVKDEVAAASMLKGMTAEYLLRRIGRVQADDVILFHAAAGGTGLIACQWAKALGCTVIGTVSSPAKESLARDNGCDFVINYEQENFLDQVMKITNGKGVRLVYDSVGRDTFEGTIGCLSPRGLFVSFGQSSGPVPPVDLRVFNPKSLFYTRPTLFSYVATRAELLDSSQALFGAIGSGKVKISINQRYPLREVAQAHADLEGRRTTGSTVLIP
jgi:NADPH2:quinone reductase